MEKIIIKMKIEKNNQIKWISNNKSKVSKMIFK